MCVLSFADLFRPNELLNIRVCHGYSFARYLMLLLGSLQGSKSKTDVHRKVQDVFIHKSGNSTCPYHLLLRYLDSADIIISLSSQFLFWKVVLLRSNRKYILGNRKVSYTCFKWTRLRSTSFRIAQFQVWRGYASIAAGNQFKGLIIYKLFLFS